MPANLEPAHAVVLEHSQRIEAVYLANITPQASPQNLYYLSNFKYISTSLI